MLGRLLLLVHFSLTAYKAPSGLTKAFVYVVDMGLFPAVSNASLGQLPPSPGCRFEERLPRVLFFLPSRDVSSTAGWVLGFLLYSEVSGNVERCIALHVRGQGWIGLV